MRIGLVCPYDLSRPGGVQSQVRGLARHLRADGDEVTVIAPGLRDDDDVDGVDLGGTVPVPGNRSKAPISPDPRVGRKIERAAGDLDLLHVHEPLMPAVSLGALRAGAPVVATFHAAPGALGRGFYSVLGSQLLRLLGPHVKRVTAVSSTAAAPLPESLEVTIIPNGVDVQAFSSDVERAQHRVAFLGRDEPRKGLDVLLEAWNRVRQEIPDAELLVMGADRSSPGVSWKGIVDEAEKRQGLGSSSVYVAPNLGGESFGITIVEAMAAGAAVVASDLGAFRDVGGEAVRYFPAGDPRALGDELVAILGDPTTMAMLSRAGQERARRFDWPTIVSGYRAVYTQAIS